MTERTSIPSNHLNESSSPYLLQHANNPVDWWPWCEEALQLARDQQKPILLSIGYSACHWCHVMAHESFEDTATASLMNELYVNIKVDREERPDLDKIYQTAHQLLNQRPGGWPLTAILTPDDHTPFFVGTYFPKTGLRGMPAFSDVLQQVAAFYHHRYDDILQQNHALINALGQTLPGNVHATAVNSTPIQQACQQLLESYDPQYGGFGRAPKFPHPTSIELLLRQKAIDANRQMVTAYLDAAQHTLQAMAAGGVYDQIGGGFCRYSVDDQWMIPHFEKMLYDNGPLLGLYADAAIIFENDDFKRIATETAQWVMNEMQSEAGGYYATQDADSEGEEGKFYVWTPAEVRRLLTDDEYRLVATMYGLDQPANFEGHWHLHTYLTLTETANKLRLDHKIAHDLLTNARQKLYTARSQRVWPGKDEKNLCSWNALMIKGIAIAGRRLQQDELITSAERAVEFISNNMYVKGRLLASYKDGRAQFMAYLDDYAFLIDALLELLQSRWNSHYLKFAIELADCLLEHFADKQQGGFYFTANDHESLYHRPKPFGDESTPAGNGVAAYALQRLGYLLAEPRYLQAAENTLRNAWAHITQVPYAHCSLLLALQEYLSPPKIVILRGAVETLQDWQVKLQQDYEPTRLVFTIPADSQGLPPALASKAAQSQTTAYLCEGLQCQAPINDINLLQERL